MSIRTVQRIIRTVAKKTDISKAITPQVLRHTFALNCINKGMPNRDLMELLGIDYLKPIDHFVEPNKETIINILEQESIQKTPRKISYPH